MCGESTKHLSDVSGASFRTVPYRALSISLGSLEGSSRESPARSPGHPQFSRNCFYRQSRAMSALPFSLLFGAAAQAFSFFTASPRLISASGATIPPFFEGTSSTCARAGIAS